jgi:hypothetical protein
MIIGTVGHEDEAIGRSPRHAGRYLTFPHKKSPPNWAFGGLLSSKLDSERLDVRRLQALRAALDLELDFLAFLERLEAAHLDRGVMREQIFAAFGRGDEAEAFGVVEPLDGAGCHVQLLPMLNAATIPGATKPGMTIKEVN